MNSKRFLLTATEGDDGLNKVFKAGDLLFDGAIVAKDISVLNSSGNPDSVISRDLLRDLALKLGKINIDERSSRSVADALTALKDTLIRFCNGDKTA